MLDPIEQTRRLIDIPSVTGEEAAVGKFLIEQLSGLGYVCEAQEVEANRFNVWASAGGRPRVLLNTHLDTVPPWFGAREDDDFLYGRGACDAKGAIAAMLGAGERLRAGGFRDFAFLFTVGEETDSLGAKAANVACAGRGSEYVLTGEPTESTFARASKGALTVFARFGGKAGHSAYPERGDSAINKMVAAITEINATDWGTSAELGRATVNVGVVRGGEKPNVIPPVAECDMVFRTVGPPEEVRAKLDALLAGYGGSVVKSPPGSAPQTMIVPEGKSSVVVAFGSDIPYMKALGKPLLFGAGSILDAHGPNEKIAKRELLDAVQTYHDTVLALCQS